MSKRPGCYCFSPRLLVCCLLLVVAGTVSLLCIEAMESERDPKQLFLLTLPPSALPSSSERCSTNRPSLWVQRDGCIIWIRVCPRQSGDEVDENTRFNTLKYTFLNSPPESLPYPAQSSRELKCQEMFWKIRRYIEWESHASKGKSLELRALNKKCFDERVSDPPPPKSNRVEWGRFVFLRGKLQWRKAFDACRCVSISQQRFTQFAFSHSNKCSAHPTTTVNCTAHVPHSP